MKDFVHHVLGPGTHEWQGAAYRTILPSEDTGGNLSITDTVNQPGDGPPRHIHHGEDETFVVLSGEVVFWLAGHCFRRGPGEVAFVPRGVEHSFRTIGEQPSRTLVIFSPGGFEGFFVELAKNGYRVPEDMDAIARAGAAYNLTFTGPPLAAGEIDITSTS